MQKKEKKKKFKPGDDVNKLVGGKIAEETRNQLKNKVKQKFATKEADVDAERYEDENGEEEEEEEEEEDDVWDGEDEDEEQAGIGNGGSAVLLDKSVRFNEGSLTQQSRSNDGGKSGGSGSGGGGGGGLLEDSMAIGQTLEDGSVVVDPSFPEDRYSEYEVRYDEWGQEVKGELWCVWCVCLVCVFVGSVCVLGVFGWCVVWLVCLLGVFGWECFGERCFVLLFGCCCVGMTEQLFSFFLLISLFLSFFLFLINNDTTVKLPPKVAPMAKTKKDLRIDPFEIFKKKKIKEAKDKKMRRHQKLQNGLYHETTNDAEFVTDLGYKESTIRQALGHGKHTPQKVRERRKKKEERRKREKKIIVHTY